MMKKAALKIWKNIYKRASILYAFYSKFATFHQLENISDFVSKFDPKFGPQNYFYGVLPFNTHSPKKLI